MKKVKKNRFFVCLFVACVLIAWLEHTEAGIRGAGASDDLGGGGDGERTVVWGPQAWALTQVAPLALVKNHLPRTREHSQILDSSGSQRRGEEAVQGRGEQQAGWMSSKNSEVWGRCQVSERQTASHPLQPQMFMVKLMNWKQSER